MQSGDKLRKRSGKITAENWIQQARAIVDDETGDHQ